MPQRVVSINRPRSEPRHYRASGRVKLDDGGTGVTITAKNDVGGTHWVTLTPALVIECVAALCPDDESVQLLQLLEDYGVDTPRTLTKTLLENFYVYPHMEAGQ